MARDSKKANPFLRVGARTDTGRVREHNEDSMLVNSPVLVVADGVGGREAGEVASKIAVDTLDAESPRTPDAKLLGRAVEMANNAIIQAIQDGTGRSGMGTTVTAAVVGQHTMAVAQVGDSRAYRLRSGKLEQLTQDHSLVAAMVQSGQITAHEAMTHPKRSIITRALGSDIDAYPDLYEFEVLPGDRFLLCSDGLCGVLYEEDIENILLDTPDPQIAADVLVNAANQVGGPDNITVIVADVAGSTKKLIKNTARTAKKRGRSKKRLSVIVFCSVAAVLIACAIGGFFLFVKNSAYLIAEDGRVALYSGRLESFMGMNFSWYEETSDIEVEDLPALTAQRLEDGIQFDSMDQARDALSDYEQQIILTQSQDDADSTEDNTDSSNSSVSSVSSISSISSHASDSSVAYDNTGDVDV